MDIMTNTYLYQFSTVPDVDIQYEQTLGNQLKNADKIHLAHNLGINSQIK